MNNTDIFNLSDGDTIIVPTPAVITGTITSVGKVVTGTGTNFTRDLLTSALDGQLLYDFITNDTGDIAEIKQVVSDTKLFLKYPFPHGDAVGSEIKKVGTFQQQARKITINFAAGAIQTKVIIAGNPEGNQTGNNSFLGLPPAIIEDPKGLKPLSIKAMGGAVDVIVEYV